MAGASNLQDLVQHDRVHSRVYTDPEIFARETEKIFHRAWLYVGHESEVPRPGDYSVRNVGGESVIMVRTENGDVRLLLNRCRHRGAVVCARAHGNATAFQCGYHGWTYRCDGELIGVPNPDGYDTLDRREYGLVPVARMENYRGLIFASLSANGASFEEHLNPHARAMLDIIMDLSPEGEIYIGKGVYRTRYAANWKFVGMDGYHALFTHRSAIEIAKMRRGESTKPGEAAVRNNLAERNNQVSATSHEARDLGNGHVMLDFWRPRNGRVQQILDNLKATSWGREYLSAMEKNYGKERAVRNLTWQGDPHMGLFPNFQYVGYHIRVIEPVSVDETVVTMYPVLLKGVPREINIDRLRQHEWFFSPCGAGTPDDNEMFERMQTGLKMEEDPWVLLSRGLAREQADNGTVVSHHTDELTQRAQMRQWLKMMTEESLAANGSSRVDTNVMAGAR